MSEEWLPIVGYEKYYEVSNLGRVRSIRYKKLLKPWLNDEGYPQVGLCVNYVKKHFRVHRLVLEAFVGPCPEGHETRHYPDQSKTNNNLANLSWATTQVNVGDNNERGMYCLGRLTPEQVKEIRSIELPYGKKNEYCKQLGISRTTFHVIRRREAYAHIGD